MLPRNWFRGVAMSEPQKSSKCLRGVLWLGLHRLDCGVSTEGREAGAESGPSIPTFRFDDQGYSSWPRNLLDHALRQALPSGTLTLGLPVAAQRRGSDPDRSDRGRPKSL